MCGSDSLPQAHHIFRRSLYPDGRYEPGNGITLCRECHSVPHTNFNCRPDLSLPIDAEGGDDQDLIASLYAGMLSYADQKSLAHDEFYYIGDPMLQFFVRVQGYVALYWSVQAGEITRLQMAHEIWRVMPETFYRTAFQSLIELNPA